MPSSTGSENSAADRETSMFHLTLRNIARRKLRYALTTLAVVLGVAFLSTSFFLTDKIRDTFDELATDITGDIDLVVRTTIGRGEDFNRLPIPEELESIVAGVPGVAGVDPRIMMWNVIPIIPAEGDEKAHDLPVSRLGRESLDFSFSGLKTSLLYAVCGRPEGRGADAKLPRDASSLSRQEKADFAASFQRADETAFTVRR